MPPNPARVDEMGLRANAAVLEGKLSWSSVASSIGAPVGTLADLFQERSPNDPDMKTLLEAILDDCGG